MDKMLTLSVVVTDEEELSEIIRDFQATQRAFIHRGFYTSFSTNAVEEILDAELS